MTLTDDELTAIRGRLEAAESSRISAPSVGTDYSPRQARDDIRALLEEVERLRGCLDHANREADRLLLGGERLSQSGTPPSSPGELP